MKNTRDRNLPNDAFNTMRRRPRRQPSHPQGDASHREQIGNAIGDRGADRSRLIEMPPKSEDLAAFMFIDLARDFQARSGRMVMITFGSSQQQRLP
jgi:hypothetical protein